MRNEKEKEVDLLRAACGTLPNRVEKIKTDIYFGCEKLDIEMVDEPRNMYKAIFHMATATWGDEEYENKWKKVTPEIRYKVVLNALRGKTLPTALEAPKFTFIVRGVPRHCFDQMARTRLGSAFGSIGCRDNSKLDTSFILYSEYKKFPEVQMFRIKNHIMMAKEIYRDILTFGKESYQVARSILPFSYHHPFVFTQNLIALLSQARRRMCFGEEEFIAGIHWRIRDLFEFKGYSLIADAMRPHCDFAKKCLYSDSELFSNLFAGCGRWPSKSSYSEFNKSCTDSEELKKHIPNIPSPEEYVNFTENDYKKLGSADIALFNEN